MNRLTKLFASALCVAAAALALTACGGGDAGAPPSAIDQPTTAPPPDTTPPTVGIFNDLAAPPATGPVTFTFVFNEDVGTSFNINAITVTGGTPGALTNVSVTQRTLVVTPAAGASGTISVAVRVGSFSDLAGNINVVVPAAAEVPFNTVSRTQMALPVTFDSTTVEYGLIGFGGAEDSSIAVDPTDAANMVAKVVRAAGAETYAGTTITAAAGLGFSPKIPFNANDTRMSVRVWSPDANIPVRLKVEDHTNAGKSVETEATVTTAAGWQTLVFNFAPGSQSAGTAAIDFAASYDKATIFFDFGRPKASAVQKTYYFDDVTFVPGSGGGGGGGASGSTGTCTGINCTTFSEPGIGFGPFENGGGGTVAIVNDPNDASNKVVKFVKKLGDGDYFGTTITGLAAPAVLTASSKTITLRVFSPAVGTNMLLKLEGGTGGPGSTEKDVVTTVANAWETLSFVMPDAGTFTTVVVFPNGRSSVAADTIIYIDELKFPAVAGGGGGGAGSALITFDEVPPPTLTDFGTNGAGASIVVDPAGGTNKVLKVNKYLTPTQSEQWAGTTISTGAGDSIAAIPFAADAKILTARVYSPAAGVRVRLKVEDASNAGVSVETDALTTTSGAWEVLSFNFANPGLSPPVGGGPTAPLDLTKTYNRLSIFMDFGIGNGGSANLPGNRVYYVDDISFVPGAGGGGGGGGPAVTFSSGFGATLTVEAGAYGGYSGSSVDGFNCGAPASCGSGGSFTPAVPAASSSFYYYYQTPSPVTALYAGIFIQAPGLTTGLSATGDTPGLSVAGKTTVKFTLGQNPEWFSSPTPNFGVILTLGKFYDVDAGSAVQACNIKLLAVVTPTAAAGTNYSIPISSFAIIQNCNVSGLTPASALALSPLSQVDFQAVGSANPLPPVGGKLVGANMSVGVGSPPVYPTTLAIGGGITFE